MNMQSTFKGAPLEENALVRDINQQDEADHIAVGVFDFVFGLQNYYAASDEHMALGMFQAAVTATRERLCDPQRLRISKAMFLTLDRIKTDEEMDSLQIGRLPGYVDGLADELLEFLYEAEFTQREGFILLLAVFNAAAEKLIVRQEDKQQLIMTLFSALPSVNN